MAIFLGPVIEWLSANPVVLRELRMQQKQYETREQIATDTVECTDTKTASQVWSRETTMLSTIDRLNRVKIKRPRAKRAQRGSQLQVLWVTPLRALATDTEKSLRDAIEQLGITWQIEKRTGDTDPTIRNRQRKNFPDVLVTTPESLTLMLSWPDSLERFSALRLIVVDEWHELIGSKRGVQTELALARIRRLNPRARIWALSATMANLQEALETLIGCPRGEPASHGRLIRGDLEKRVEINSIIPEEMERFPWAGHLGTKMAAPVAQLIARSQSTLVFTNTRSQTEFWYRAIIAQLPEMAGQIAVHHGSLDRQLRAWVEQSLRDGKLRCCVCTSSLDLGVDFSVVDQVIQIGSPKGNARLLQRAGRSGHQPGVASRITFVPTNAIELIELAALRSAIEQGQIESRTPILQPLDVLAQHVVTIALSGGFEPSELLEEIRSTHAFAQLSDVQWKWVLDFAERGGSSLYAYPDFHRLVNENGRFVVNDNRIARLHRLSIGTIVSDAAINVRYLKGRSIGTVEESFIGRMEPGDKFMLAGRLLELIKIFDNTAWVKRAKGNTTTIPRWMGGRMPLSSELSEAIREKLQSASEGKFESNEMRAVLPLLELQSQWSLIPRRDQLLIERLKNRDGFHLFFYPFDGRLVHEGMAALIAWRLSRVMPISFSMAMNDYGFVLMSPEQAPIEDAIARGLFNWEGIAGDIFSTLNSSEMSRRQFREVARIAGLIFEGYPGQRKSARHLQASSNLFYDVFANYDPDNLLLLQAKREVLDRQLEQHRLIAVLKRIEKSKVVIQDLKRPTPLAFPLIVDSLRDRLSSEKLSDRIRRMQETLNNSAGN
jgi:ATP-dependent helicase Lhr and Lhr-like helicase